MRCNLSMIDGGGEGGSVIRMGGVYRINRKVTIARHFLAMKCTFAAHAERSCESFRWFIHPNNSKKKKWGETRNNRWGVLLLLSKLMYGTQAWGMTRRWASKGCDFYWWWAKLARFFGTIMFSTHWHTCHSDCLHESDRGRCSVNCSFVLIDRSLQKLPPLSCNSAISKSTFR